MLAAAAPQALRQVTSRREACAGASFAPSTAVSLFRRILILLAAVAAIAAVYLGVVAPWYRTWGAAADEQTRQLPGDDILTGPCRQETRAITIEAPPERVWPWVAQLGQDRAGFYSFRLLENLVGARMPHDDRLMPDKQAWRVGDRMWMAPPEKFGGIGHADLVTYEPGRALAFATWVVPPRPGERKAAEGSWSFVVEPAPESAAASRLIVRGRTVVETPWLNRLFQLAVFEPLHFAMERKMMTGIADRVRGRGPTPVADGFLVVGWLVMVACFVAGAVLLLRGRPVGRATASLGVGAAGFAALSLLQPGPAVATALALLAVGVVPWRRRAIALGPTALDQILPQAEFRAHVAVRTKLPPEALLGAFHAVNLGEMPLAAALGWLRYLPSRWSGRPVPPPAPRPFLDLLLEGGNVILHRAPSEEIVGCIGKLHQITNQEQVRLASPEAFATFDDPRYQKLAMSVRVEGAGASARLVLEHRTHALGGDARRAFAMYWMVIRPLGNLVSWLLLRAIVRRVQRGRTAAAQYVALTSSSK